MNAVFTYYGGMAVQVVREDGLKLLFDPYLTGNTDGPKDLTPFYDTDYLFITHAAFDHFGDAVEICRHSRCKVCCGSEVLRKIRLEYPLPDDRWHLAVYGDEYILDSEAACRPVPAFHLSVDASEGVQTNWNSHGFVVKICQGLTYYHTGDTAIYSDMKLWRELYHPQVMCVGISAFSPEYPREMTAREAALAVGSGVVNDLCKVVGKATGRPSAIVGTAPSMDGYASNSSSMEMDHVKVSLYNHAPVGILLDTEILAQAPMRMLWAGLGDMVAKYIAVCEWRVSALVTGEYYCEEIAEMMRTAVKRVVGGAAGIPARDPDAIGAIAEGLIIAGVAMAYAEISRPASGLEHYFSHMWEMMALERDLPYDLHGIPVNAYCNMNDKKHGT